MRSLFDAHTLSNELTGGPQAEVVGVRRDVGSVLIPKHA